MMNARIRLCAALLLSLLYFGTAAAAARRVTDPTLPRALPVEGSVQVEWSDPAQFREIRWSRSRFDASRGDWVRTLAKWIRKRAEPRLGAGETLEVRVTDIKRAGEYEPGRQYGLSAPSDHVRVLREVYPPRIHLEFRLLDAQGQVLLSGERKLRDSLYLHRGIARAWDSDPLRYEKGLIDDWVRREFGRLAAQKDA